MDSTDNTITAPQPTLFYDGECGFCNGSVRFVLNHEKQPILSFAPLQGQTAAEALRNSGLPGDIGKNSVVLYDQGRFYVRSQAARRTMSHMGGLWKMLSRLAGVVPVSLADGVYNLVARNRHRIPYNNSCGLLPPEQRKRFLP